MGFPIAGREIQCVVFGLNGTIWDGSAAEDGPAGIRPFQEIQQFLKSARDAGARLAVAAKDDMKNAVAPFECRPEMILKRADISVFCANWDGNAENLPAIRKALGVDYDSMLFLEADPFERELVRGLFPEALVPELPLDPAGFRLSTPAAGLADLDAFLESLDMRVELAPLEHIHVRQAVGFLARNSQFNLAVRRYTEAECESLLRNPAILPLMVRLRDQLCDYGLIAVLVLSVGEDEITIQDWVMSARLAGRGIEEYLMNSAVGEARRRGCTRVAGEYTCSAANGMVRELYARFGFTMFGDDPDRAFWLLPVMAYDPMPTFVRGSRGE